MTRPVESVPARALLNSTRHSSMTVNTINSESFCCNLIPTLKSSTFTLFDISNFQQHFECCWRRGPDLPAATSTTLRDSRKSEEFFWGGGWGIAGFTVFVHSSHLVCFCCVFVSDLLLIFSACELGFNPLWSYTKYPICMFKWIR